MKPLFKNIKSEKITSTGAIALLLVVAARLFGLKTDELAGIPITDIATAAVEAVTAIILLFARDPKQKETGGNATK